MNSVEWSIVRASSEITMYAFVFTKVSTCELQKIVITIVRRTKKVAR